MCNLTEKYNVPGPRYTSYPTVPYWDLNSFSGSRWKTSVKQSFKESKEQGISLYIHLPFCEQMCTFCGCHKRITKRHEVELPYINAVLKEWNLYCNLLGSRPKIKELHLGGGTPTFFSPENLTRLVEGILSLATVHPKAEFSFEGHPNNTTEAHLKALFNVGFRRVCFGVQDYNNSVQVAINRLQPFEKVKQVTEIARQMGYTSVGHDLIYGLPFQTLEDVKNTIVRTNDLSPDRIAFYSYAHVPWRKGNGQRGYREADLPTPEQKQEQYEIGRQWLSGMGYKHIGMDHFALGTDALYEATKSRRLHRNFMGYTPSKTQLMIGLGVSSISDSWHGFSQNVKSIEEYQHLVANDIIPFYRGHLLSEEDEILRSHILNLMCRFETTWKTSETQKINFHEITSALAEFEADGLVIIGQNSVFITEKGRPFLRNIAMAFDLRLQRKKPETRLFSMTV
ncbi:oxygen-independent coproporphyrinogen III oxidase [Croceivirga thetidis]|uniref:Coproporphyrinogen-III oxidase n=1 Tax=Croceivirga thetidis TaxID=2721623 RepID=A0ABX1GMY2_9FLAO|nr:oxygen-independent coproporphyrinogen III oxidase [Croceivirga thetidis]NKI31276.1 oxygen-independent coproporphyrinogen III oxidase [Croceivirga thetidis]